MKFDISTIVFFTSLMFLALTIIVYAEYKLNKIYKGPGWWVTGTLLQCAGFFLMLALTITPIRMLSIFANPLVCSGQLAINIGILKFLERKDRISMQIVLFAIFLVVYNYFIFFRISISGRTAAISVFMCINALQIAINLIRWKHRSFAESANLTAAVFFIYAFFEALVVAITLALPPISTYNSFYQAPIRVISFVIPIIGSILWTYGIILMSNQRLNAENAEEKEKLQMVFNLSPDAKLITRLDDGELVEVNDAFLKQSGYAREEVIGTTTFAIHCWENPGDRRDYIAGLREKKALDNKETVFRNKDGSTYTGLVSGRVLMIHDEPHLVSVVTDITEHKQTEQKIRDLLAEKELQYDRLIQTQEKLIVANAELERISGMDKLTGLFNRRKLNDILDHEILRLTRFGGKGTLIMADIDHFKEINDTYGHLTGDEVLISLAEILRDGIRKVDYCFRWGGEEFLILLTETGFDEAMSTAEKIRQKIENERLFDTEPVTLSFGVAAWREGWGQEEWIKSADTSLYAAKNNGRNRVEGQS